MTPATPSRRRIAELDALRGLCALAVALYHLTFFAAKAVPGLAMPSVTIWWGCYGVQVFFGISGFVILGTLERTPNLAAFGWARARRLLPEYWLAMATTTAVAAAFAPPSLTVGPVTWLRNLAPVQLWTGTPMIDGVYWSLNVEIAFYLAIALAWRFGWTRRIEAVVLGWLAVKWLLWLLPPFLDPATAFMVVNAPYFAVGLLAYRIWTGERRWTEQLPALAATGASVALLDPIHAHWLFAGMVPLFLALATGRLAWLARPPLVRLGRISYPLYLLHAVIGYTVMARLEALGLGADLAALAALAIAMLLATAAARLCERARAGLPATARRSRSAGGGRASAAPAASGI